MPEANQNTQIALRDRTTKHCKPIDGLRAIAVLAVIVSHFNEEIMPSGYLGVDIFFVISGAVITFSLLENKSGHALHRISTFYQRRFKRLFPALSIVIAFSGVAICALSKAPRDFLYTGLSATVGFSNVFLYFETIDYWGSAATVNPFTHTWSLGVEEQFYFIFPFFIVMLSNTQSIKNVLLTATFTSLLIVISLLLFVTTYTDNFAAAYYLAPYRFWELGLGSIACLALRHLPIPFLLVVTKVPPTPLAAGIIVLMFGPENGSVLLPVILPLLTTVLIVQMCANETCFVANLLSTRALQHLGKLSYSLYLWHWPILVIGRWTIGLSIYSCVFLLLSTYCAGTLSYYFIENPLRNAPWRNSRRVLIAFSPIVVYGCLLSLFFFDVLEPNNLYLGGYRHTVPSIDKTLPTPEELCSEIRSVGNSHSHDILPMLDAVTKGTGINVSRRGFDLGFGRDSRYAGGDYRVLDGLVKNDVVIFSSRLKALHSDYSELDADTVVEQENLIDNWLDNLDHFVEASATKGIKTILFLPRPEFSRDIQYFELYEPRWYKPFEAPVISRDDIIPAEIRFPHSFFTRLRERADALPHLYLFDPSEFLKDHQGQYRFIINGTAAYKDNNHLSTEGAMLLAQPFWDFLISNEVLTKNNH